MAALRSMKFLSTMYSSGGYACLMARAAADYREMVRNILRESRDSSRGDPPNGVSTTEPNELVRPVHNRMPVILRPEDEEQWLDGSRIPFVKAKSLLQPYPEELMDAHDVSAIVKSAKYDGPECIQPIADDDMPRGGQLSLL